MNNISFDYEKKFIKNTSDIVVGIDEAGRGCLAGPVVSACCWLNINLFPTELLSQINDSKKLTENKRTEIFNKLQKLQPNIFLFSYSYINASLIDKINILQATLLSMKHSYIRLKNKLQIIPEKVLVDGNIPPDIPNVKLIIKGDQLSYSIATASIIAKVKKDELLNKIGDNYKEYMFDKNKGYGTKFHLAALQKYGVTPYHRKSYKPVAKYLINKSV